MAPFWTLCQVVPAFHPAIIFGAAASAILMYAFYNILFHPLARIPGPIWVRSGLWSWKSTRAVKLDIGWKLLELHEKYGKIVRIARNEASICDPGAIEQIFKFKSPLQKTRFYESLRGVDGHNLLTTIDNQKHGEIRRAESPAYATKLLADFEQNVDSCCNDLIGYLDRCIDAGKGTVDLSEILQLFAIDVIGELALGKSFGFCAIGKDPYNLLPLLVKFLEIACLVGTQPFVSPFVMWLSKKLPEPPSAGAIPGIVRGRIDSRLQEYKEQGTNSGHHDTLERFMSCRNPDGSEYSLQQIRAATGLVLGAGSDTTAITMRAMIRFVVGDPRIYSKVQEEIDDAVSSGAITFPLSYSDACKLSYFQACLKETLRLHPAVPWALPRLVGAGGATIAGHFFTEGTEVSMSPFVVHRRPEAYGNDAAVFRPERWIEADAEELRTMEHNNLAFGSGPRVCFGKAIGMMEVSKAMPLLFWKYRMGFTPRSATSPHKHAAGRAVDGCVSTSEPYFVTSQWVAVQSDFWCDLARRTD
ncbi:cytochrome P450 oxidoreductase [Mycena rosella]|uniref:Cytochrome P450 oxidoreductase n=1 Tax=Mycena rosella TaxID=1033263 RepID=A0AAD7DBY1_MYCRO|nr:cytochrome P450 oxidoreductase [Mycena rosella]